MTPIEEALETLSLLLRDDTPGALSRLESGHPRALEFSDLCRRHGLRTLVLDSFDPPQLARLFSDRERERLERVRRREIAAQRELLDELDRLASAFSDAGLVFLLLKGPHLAQRFYGGLHRRFWGDLDLLIRRQELGRVHRLLRGAGYERLSRPFLSDPLCARFTHGFDYARGDYHLDLHWSLGVSAAYSLDGAELWRDSQTLAIGSRELRVLSDEHCLMALLVSFFEDLQRGAGKLKSLVDVHRVIGSARLDWPLFFERRGTEGTESACRAVLGLYLRWLGAAEHPALAEALGPQRVATVAPATLLGARRGSAGNRRWAARHTDASRAATLRWWLVGLPFRLAVYRPGRLRRRWRRTLSRYGGGRGAAAVR